MRTVLHLSPSVKLLGARQSLLQMAQHLNPERWRSVCVLPFDEGDMVDALDEADIKCHTVRMGPWRKPKHWMRIPFDLHQLVSIAHAEKVDLVHCNEPHVMPYGLHIAKKLGIPCVMHLRLNNTTVDLVRKYRLDKADRIIAVTKAVANQFEALDTKHPHPVIIIPNGLNVSEMQEAAMPRDKARSWLSLKDHEHLIGQVGLISPRKRQHVVLQAFSLIASKIPNTRLFIIGSPGKSDAVYAKSLSMMIEQQGLEGRVTMLPFRRDISSIYAAMDVNLLVSGEEGFGRVIIEAAAFGVPTIGTRVGGIPEVIRDGETGILTDLDNPEMLAEKITRLIADKERRLALGRAAKEDLMARFSIDQHVERIMALFDSLVDPDNS